MTIQRLSFFYLLTLWRGLPPRRALPWSSHTYRLAGPGIRAIRDDWGGAQQAMPQAAFLPTVVCQLKLELP